MDKPDDTRSNVAADYARAVTGPDTSCCGGPVPKGVIAKRGRRKDTHREVLHGEVPEEPVMVREHGMQLRVDLHRGQKTGLFLDHRRSRRTARRVAEGARVLNLYGYTGGFSIA